MGSTSETYENGTNVVVYVANENAHIRSQQQQQHQYHSHNIVSAHLHTKKANNESIYNVCPQYGPSAITVTNYESDSVVVAEKNSSSFNISHQNDSDSCTINGDSMRDNTSFASYNDDEGDKLLINNNLNPCYTGNGSNVESVPVLAATASFISEKFNESSGANFVSVSETSYVRSESVRSADSVTSACSSLSSSSAGNSNSKVASAGENFAVNVSANTNANCATGGANFNSNQSRTFSPCRIVSASNQESASNSFPKQNISVPFGWKRLLNNGSVIYISPSNSVLTSLEQVNSYLLTDGNCFCGLDCPLYSHTVFNFDPEVVTSPVPANLGGFAKLCNHKRKRITTNNLPSTSLPNQSYENIPLQSNSVASRPLITNYCNPGAIVKKHAFDISDRRKKRKIMPGQMYVNDDVSVPSSNIMVHDCDISAKENNPSVISAGSQVDPTIYNQQMGMALGMVEQQLPPTMGSAVRFANQQGYRQNYDCFPMNANPTRPLSNQNNMFATQEDSNNSGYVCKTNMPLQACVGNTSINQHQHLSCNNMIKQHRVACNENGMMSQNHPMNGPHQNIMSQQQHQQQQQQQQQFHQQQQQFQQQHQQPMLNQQTNYPQMRVIPNHQHHHHHVHHHNNTVMHNSMNMMDASVNVQMIQDNKYTKQIPQAAGFMMQEKSDKGLCHQNHENEHLSVQSRTSNNGNTFCSCYHGESGHVHQSPSHLQNSCMSDCSNSCSSVIVQNAQGQQIMMQQNHHMVSHDMQPQVMHHQNTPQHHQHMQNQMQPQVYQHHAHHQTHQSQQLTTKGQLMHIVQQQQQQQHQHQQQQQMQVMQNQNQYKNNQNRCGQMMYANNTTQRQPILWQQKNVQNAAVNTNHNHNTIQCSEASSATTSPPNPYERVPPLHPHVPPSPSWNNEDSNCKKCTKSSNKSPTSASAKKMKISYGRNNYQEGRTVNQISTNTTTVSSSITTTTMVKDKNEYPSTPVPSFMEDPSGYLAQQTALLNSTISNSSFPYKTQNRHQQEESPVTSSTYDRERNASVSPSESKSPIQADTVSTSNQSPVQPGMTSPSNCSTPSTNNDMLPQSPAVTRNSTDNDSPVTTAASPRSSVTTVAGGHSCSSSTITSVLAVKANTTVVSPNSASNQHSPASTTVTSGNSSSSSSVNEDNCSSSSSTAVISISNVPHIESQITKSPLEMVQNVVSSIQILQQNIETKSSIPQNNLQTSHFLVSNNGQLLVATSSNPTQSQNLTKVNSSPVSMINNSSVVTNVTGTMTQVIPTVGMTQQVLSQPTVLVNTLPSGQLVFQPNVMAVDSAGNAVQIPQLAVATNNMMTDAGTISVATSGSFSPRAPAQLLSPETAKIKISNKKRKLSPQQVLQITQSGSQNGVVTSAAGNGAASAATNGASVVMQPQTQQNFAQSAPMLQTLILPNKNGQFASTQPLIATANVLQPMNLVHNIPTIQQFIVPTGLGGLGSMVMANGDGTATILPETVQLNVLTPVQNTAETVFSQMCVPLIGFCAAAFSKKSGLDAKESISYIESSTFDESSVRK